MKANRFIKTVLDSDGYYGFINIFNIPSSFISVLLSIHYYNYLFVIIYGILFSLPIIFRTFIVSCFKNIPKQKLRVYKPNWRRKEFFIQQFKYRFLWKNFYSNYKYYNHPIVFDDADKASECCNILYKNNQEEIKQYFHKLFYTEIINFDFNLKI